ncbi:MAG: transcription termination/antitermination protein NusG [Anaerolineae bacterium]|nr:transcription termination/antitermination protein NusG [Anaerolineae bacterium]
MEEKDPKVAEPTEEAESPVKGKATESDTQSRRPPSGDSPSPDANDGAGDAVLGPEEIARQLFASYLEPESAQLELAVSPADGDDSTASLGEGEEPEAVELPEGLAAAEDQEGEPGAEGEAEEIEEGGRHWYVIHSYSGYESKVRKNLEHRIESLGMHDRIFQVVVPTEEEIELKDGQRRTIERRIFPGYILVEMLMDQDSWGVVRNTPGVTGFVGTRNEPTPLRRQDVDRVLKRMRAETPKVKVTFRPGQKVRIADGPFEDFVGTVDGIYPDKGKVRILVSFFGRETPVELDFLQVEKI